MNVRLRMAALRCLLVVLLFTATSGAESTGGGTFPHVHDEWEPIDRIIVASAYDSGTGRHELNTLAIFATGIASRLGIQVIISTSDEETQASILNLLSRVIIKGDGKPVISKPSDVVFVDNPFPSEWARDYSPVVVSTEGFARVLRVFDSYPRHLAAQVSVAKLGVTMSLHFYKNVPRIVLPDRIGSLKFEGGNWMTTDKGTTLITTSAAILRHKAGLNSDAVVVKAVAGSLERYFGIKKVLALEPLRRRAGRYKLNNAHVDLQVRTLPNHMVMVARVPNEDEQYRILEDNAASLANAGFKVIRLDNSDLDLPREVETGNRFFKSYTNALFLNDVVLIPAFGDKDHDVRAKQAYETALNGDLAANDEHRYVVISIAAVYGAKAIEYSGSIRCAVSGIHR